jgi:uncharacterized protein
MGRLSDLLKNPAALEAELAKFETSDEEFDEDMSFISYVNGAVTALIIGPEHVPECEWMPALLGGPEAELGEEESELARESLRLEYNSVLKSLRSRKLEYEPFFREDEESGRLITRDWAEGFLHGVSLREEAWAPWREGDALYLFAFVNVLLQHEEIDAKVAGHGLVPEEIFEVAQTSVPELIQALYGVRREAPADLDASRSLLRDVGRNDPCPCGSGKKYKKCCLT